MTTQQEKAQTLARLHAAPEILRAVNVWDVVSAKAVAALPQTKAIVTAGHSIAATFGYADGEKIPLDLMLDMVGRIVDATDLPVSADLDAGFGDPGETARRAIGVGVVGANMEDRLAPLADSVAAVEAVIAAGAAEGVPFVLNARTDAFVRAGDRPVDESIEDAVTRGRAYLEARHPERGGDRAARRRDRRAQDQRDRPSRRPVGRGVRSARRRAHLARSDDAAGRPDGSAGRRERPLRHRRHSGDDPQPQLIAAAQSPRAASTTVRMASVTRAGCSTGRP
jgi:hypothetical protein